MSEIVNVHQAKTHLSRYLNKVAAGEEVIIGKHGKPVAKLVPMPPQALRKPGALKGKIWIADDFDDPMPELIEAIEKTDP